MHKPHLVGVTMLERTTEWMDYNTIIHVHPEQVTDSVRHDSGDDATAEADCWIDGYDSGFAGKYDSETIWQTKTLFLNCLHSLKFSRFIP